MSFGRSSSSKFPDFNTEDRISQLRKRLNDLRENSNSPSMMYERANRWPHSSFRDQFNRMVRSYYLYY